MLMEFINAIFIRSRNVPHHNLPIYRLPIDNSGESKVNSLSSHNPLASPGTICVSLLPISTHTLKPYPRNYELYFRTACFLLTPKHSLLPKFLRVQLIRTQDHLQVCIESHRNYHIIGIIDLDNNQMTENSVELGSASKLSFEPVYNNDSTFVYNKNWNVSEQIQKFLREKFVQNQLKTITSHLNHHGIFFDKPEKSINLAVLVPLGILLFVFCILTILGNFMVIYVIRKDRKLRTVSNLFIMSLAFADFLLGISVMPISAIYLLSNKWIFGVVFCKIWLSIDYTASTASIFNLFILSLDRYWSIISPLHYLKKRTRRRALTMIGPAWLISAAWIIPIIGWNAFHSSILKYSNPTQSAVVDDSDNDTLALTLPNISRITLRTMMPTPGYKNMEDYITEKDVGIPIDIFVNYSFSNSSLTINQEEPVVEECNVEFANVMALKIITALINFYLPAFFMLGIYWKIFFEIKKRSEIELKLTNNNSTMRGNKIGKRFRGSIKPSMVEADDSLEPYKDSISSLSFKSQGDSYNNKRKPFLTRLARNKFQSSESHNYETSITRINSIKKSKLKNQSTRRVNQPPCHIEVNCASSSIQFPSLSISSCNLPPHSSQNSHCLNEDLYDRYNKTCLGQEMGERKISKPNLLCDKDMRLDKSPLSFNRLIVEKINYKTFEILKKSPQKQNDIQLDDYKNYGPIKVFVKYVKDDGQDKNKQTDMVNIKKSNNITKFNSDHQIGPSHKSIYHKPESLTNGGYNIKKYGSLQDLEEWSSPKSNSYNSNNVTSVITITKPKKLKSFRPFLSRLTCKLPYNWRSRQSLESVQKFSLLKDANHVRYFRPNTKFRPISDIRWNRSFAMTVMLADMLERKKRNAGNTLTTKSDNLNKYLIEKEHAPNIQRITMPIVSKELIMDGNLSRSCGTVSQVANIPTTVLYQRTALNNDNLLGKAQSTENGMSSKIDYHMKNSINKSNPDDNLSPVFKSYARIRLKTMRKCSKLSSSINQVWNAPQIYPVNWGLHFKRRKKYMDKILFKEKKAAKQLGVIMGAFIVCWLPYFIVFMITPFCESCVSNNVQITLTWLGYLNSTVNPFLYAMCNSKFKQAFFNIFFKEGPKMRPKAKKLSLTTMKYKR